MQKYVIANWKLNLPPEGVESYLAALAPSADGRAHIVVAPPYPYLTRVSQTAGALEVAGQNCADQPSGAYTGEVSPAMLRDCGATYVILGHSERRNLYGESDALIARKLALAIETGLTPVLCIGEDLKVRDAGHVARFLADQIRAVVSDALEKAGAMVVAYEPIWAIGTGRNASASICAETCHDIREAIQRFWPERFRETPILYGGSVTPANAGDLSREGRIEGFLVGGASLDSAKFRAIIDGAYGVDGASGPQNQRA